jgi:single-strand DNA-binding protein
MSMNKVILMGRVGKDPELKYTQTGGAVCLLSVATNEKYTAKDGSSKEKTDWHRVVTFNRSAENCAKYVVKGSQVLVEGKITTRTYEKDGHKFYLTEILAMNVTFIGKPAEQKQPQEDYPTENVEHVEPAFDDDSIPF